jgi:hypothetical protein
MTGDQPTTDQLKAIQTDREEAEREFAQRAEDDLEERTHERRAERAAYLADKLDDQAEALDE